MREFKPEFECAGCGGPIFRRDDADQGLLDLGVSVHRRLTCLEAYEREMSERVEAQPKSLDEMIEDVWFG